MGVLCNLGPHELLGAGAVRAENGPNRYGTAFWIHLYE